MAEAPGPSERPGPSEGPEACDKPEASEGPDHREQRAQEETQNSQEVSQHISLLDMDQSWHSGVGLLVMTPQKKLSQLSQVI